jgi:hypothetical protein
MRLRIDIEIRENVPTANVFARLPGASDEEVVLAAHTDGFRGGTVSVHFCSPSSRIITTARSG